MPFNKVAHPIILKQHLPGIVNRHGN